MTQSGCTTTDPGTSLVFRVAIDDDARTATFTGKTIANFSGTCAGNTSPNTSTLKYSYTTAVCTDTVTLADGSIFRMTRNPTAALNGYTSSIAATAQTALTLPTVTGMTPNPAQAGKPLTITGSGFVDLTSLVMKVAGYPDTVIPIPATYTETSLAVTAPMLITTSGAPYHGTPLLQVVGPGGTNNVRFDLIAPPGPPTDVLAAAGKGKATATFTAPVSTGGSPITGYIVTANPGGITATGTASPIVVNGLAPGTAYTLSVAARNAVGTGPATTSDTVIPQAPDGYLTALTVKSGATTVALSPTFTPGLIGYTALVGSTVGSITVSPTVNTTSATITVGRQGETATTVASGATSPSIPLDFGQTVINITVKIAGTTTQVTTITVTRPNTNVSSLSDLAVDLGVTSPSFASGVLSYAVTVPNATTSLKVTPRLTDPSGTVKVNGVAAISGAASTVAFAGNTMTIPVVATAADGIHQTSYSINVTRSPDDSGTLTNLVLSSGTLTPAFNTGVLNYTATVANTVDTVTLTPTPLDPTAQVTVAGVAVAAGAASQPVAVPLGGSVTIPVVVTSATMTLTYSVKVSRPRSTVATLQALSVNDGTATLAMTPGFSTGTTSYRVDVPNAITTVWISPTLTDATASLSVNDAAAVSGVASAVSGLRAGHNYIPIEVIAQDGVTATTYTVDVYRALSTVATLSDLTVGTGTLTPAFDSAGLAYTVSVSNATTSIAVTPTATDSGATLQIRTAAGTVSATSGAATTVNLSTGDNTISVIVKAQDGVTTKTYVITANRVKSSDSALANLTLGGGVALSPVFASATLDYTASVANALTSVTLTPTVRESRAQIKINGAAATSGTAKTISNLAVGATTITIQVTAEDGVSVTDYTLVVTRAASSDATLRSLTPSVGALSPAFASTTTAYTMTVSSQTASISLTAVTNATTATLTVAGAATASGASSAPIALSTGDNTIDVVVTAEDGVTTRTYSVVVTRLSASVSTLSNIAPSVGTLTPAFTTANSNYTVNVSNATTSIALTPTLTDSSATATVSLGAQSATVASGATSGAFNLAVGDNSITVTGLSYDGTSQTVYTVTVKRAPSTVSSLSALSVSQGALAPTFASGVTAYAVSVANGVTSLTVTPTVTDATATVAVNGVAVASGAASQAIALNGGQNTVRVVVTAQDGATTTTYTVTVTRAPSAAATLQGLSLSAGGLSPAFAAGTTAYTANADNQTSSTTVIATVADATATVKINNTAATSGIAFGPVALATGSNTINVEVTAQDGVTKTLYVVTVNRAKSSVATLAGLTSSQGTWTPPFATGTLSYAVAVANSVDSVTLTPTVTEANATVTVGKQGGPASAVTSGAASAAIGLDVGANAIDVVVTAQDGVTKVTYTVTFNRAGSSDATLSDLKLDGTTLPGFSGAGYTYSANVTNATTSVKLTPVVHEGHATVTIGKRGGTAAAVPSGSVSAAIALDTGANDIDVIVTAQDGVTTATYTVTVNRALSNVSTLSGLTTNQGTWDRAFDNAVTAYTVTVSNDVTSIQLTPTLTDPAASATASLGGSSLAVTSGSPVGPFTLAVGDNAITVVVRAQDGSTTTTYTVTVKRGQSSVSTLASLALSSGSLSPAFDSATTAYAVTVTNDTASINLTPVATDAGATVAVTANGAAVTLAAGVASAPLNVGTNSVVVEVTAADGVSRTSYRLTVTRQPSPNATLSALAVSSGTLTPAFATDTTAYDVAVANSVTSITLTPSVTAAGATVLVKGVATASGSASAAIPLAVGQNAIPVVVTAPDLATTTTYTIVVTRAASSLSSLAGLGLSAGTLTPTFSSAVLRYTATVPNATASVAVTPTAADAAASISVNSVAVASGVASADIPLALGDNTITVVVTAQDQSSTTYTVVVTRSGSANADLASLAPSAGALSPVFSAAVTSYSVAVSSTTTSISFTPTVADATATAKVNGVTVASGQASAPIQLVVGANSVSVVVTAQNGSTKTYLVVVTRAGATVSSLSALTLGVGTLTPTFASGTTSYTATVPNGTATITFTPTLGDPTATVKVNGVSVAAGASVQVALNTGPNTITLLVTAQDGVTTTTYTVVVTRERFTPAVALTVSSTTPFQGTDVTLTATLTNGSSPTGAVTFKDGATVLGASQVSGGKAILVTHALGLGTHSLTAAYAGDANNQPATSPPVTVTVGARPNPTSDPSVRATVAAQVSSAVRFGQQQLDLGLRRLERLHEDEPAPEERTRQSVFATPASAYVPPSPEAAAWAPYGYTNGLAGKASAFGRNGFGLGRASSGAQAFAYLEPHAFPELGLEDEEGFSRYGRSGRVAGDDVQRALQQLSSALPAAFEALNRSGTLPFQVWASGTIGFGKLKADGRYDDKFTGSALAIGLDGRIADGLKAGLALGAAFDRTDIGSNGSSSTGTAANVSVYASWRVVPRTFLDVTVGVGALSFDSTRVSNTSGVTLTGTRGGVNLFGSVGLTHDLNNGPWKMSLYGRFDGVSTSLGGYTERGPAGWTLSYDPLTTTTVSGVLGARLGYAFQTEWGQVTPMARLDYRHNFAGGYVQGLNYSDLVGVSPGFVIRGDSQSQDTVSGGLSLRIETRWFWDMELEYLLTASPERVESQSVFAHLRYRF
ncbi:cadherin-like beta sandwich domain-containing protein [Alsobacter sp. SYSU M60028]|uniref:Cadherin-like beta sandwich domain-containing protein n=1 Tax=Alsobacter ponti TaxID=2962936 RepID=A0ABT1LFE5_9HYPH|nr:cadherin-like beta sandwich domain-containing protein [Alsobacter ponti]